MQTCRRRGVQGALLLLLSLDAVPGFLLGPQPSAFTAQPPALGSAGARHPGFFAPRRHAGARTGASSLSMSKKDKRRFKLATRQKEDELLLTVAEQFNRREGQATISWYPGHIAKAEEQLKSVMSSVDLIIEVRDARIPISTTHPMVDSWLKNRATRRVVCMSKVDMVPRSTVAMWKSYLENTLDVPVAFMNCKEGGKGLIDLQKIIKAESKRINDRRAEREMLPRRIRIGVIGFPNVGKSALLNRLSSRAKAKSENRAGVTRNLQWFREEGYDLLDAPGIIPAKLLTQEIAVHLAICDDIGQASYDLVPVAAALVDEVRKVGFSLPSYVRLDGFKTRYGLEIGTYSGEEYIWRLAHHKFYGMEFQAAERVLEDFRRNRLGLMALEPPPAVPYHTGYYRVLGLKKNCTQAEVKSAFRDRARTLHPDMGGDREDWQRVLKAYEVLSEEEVRKRYDENGLVWDLEVGNYRVLKEGEVKPTVQSMFIGGGTKLLSAGGSFRPVAKMRKGQLTIPIKTSGSKLNRHSSLVTKAPPEKPPMKFK